MKQSTYTLEFITPCFCAGAEAGRAEIRASSIRGQLRWWFRALGGNRDEEYAVFGGVHSDAKASSISIRVEDVKKPSTPWQPPEKLDIASDAYVYYFAKASGALTKGAAGPRWSSTGALAPNTTFRLSITTRRPLKPEHQGQFDLACQCFLQLGGIGLRVTRGLGVFACREVPFNPSILETIRDKGFRIEHLPRPLGSHQLAREIGSFVKGSREANGMKSTTVSPFGSSSPRQTSAIYFRPVRFGHDSQDCTLVIFEAPHQRVLDRGASAKGPIVGHAPSRLSKPSVREREARRQHRRY